MILKVPGNLDFYDVVDILEGIFDFKRVAGSKYGSTSLRAGRIHAEVKVAAGGNVVVFVHEDVGRGPRHGVLKGSKKLVGFKSELETALKNWGGLKKAGYDKMGGTSCLFHGLCSSFHEASHICMYLRDKRDEYCEEYGRIKSVVRDSDEQPFKLFIQLKRAWRVEYTNHPRLTKKQRKFLERDISEAINSIMQRLKIREDYALHLSKSGLYVDLIWLPALKKHHLGMRGFETLCWVASIVFDGHPTLTVEEAKSILRSLGLNERNIDGLGMTNEKTVGEHLADCDEATDKAGEEWWPGLFDYRGVELLEAELEKGVISSNDGLLDALRKIDQARCKTQSKFCV